MRLASRAVNPALPDAQGWAMHRRRTTGWWESLAAARIAPAVCAWRREAKGPRLSRASWDRRGTGTYSQWIRAARRYRVATDLADICRHGANHRRQDRNK